MLGVSSYSQYFINGDAQMLKEHATEYDMNINEGTDKDGDYFMEAYDKDVNIICYFTADSSQIYLTFLIPHTSKVFLSTKGWLSENWIEVAGNAWDTYHTWGAIHGEMKIGPVEDFKYPYFSFKREIY